eukprot:392782_1
MTDQNEDPVIQEAIDYVHDNTSQSLKLMLEAEVNKIRYQMPHEVDIEKIIAFPPPYIDTNEKIMVNCCNNDKDIPLDLKLIYEIPHVDEYYGTYNDINVYQFDENEETNYRTDWYTEVDSGVAMSRKYFQGVIAKPLYQIPNINNYRPNQHDINPIMKYKQFNEWEEVDINNLADKNEISTTLLGDSFDIDEPDLWLTLIAFAGYASHRTQPIKANNEHPNSYFVNDVTFLAQYDVRDGFETYGAAAYFNSKYRPIQIFLSATGETYTPPNDDGTGSTMQRWNHAKWAWKVSVSVAIFLVDFVAHSRLCESVRLITAIQDQLSADHPIRRLLLPFTIGTTFENCKLNSHLHKNGMYHRVFAFKYQQLQRLIRDSISYAPILRKGEMHTIENKMKYEFRLLKVKLMVLKKLPDEIFPIYADFLYFWIQTLNFVEEYISLYYNDDDADDSVFENDTELVAFYDQLSKHLGIPTKYRLKKFNIINILTHFICNSTIWDHHLNTSISFELSMDIDFTGLKIIGNNAADNNINNYVEYCLIVLSKQRNFDAVKFMDTKWNLVLRLDDNNSKASDIFNKYFEDSLKLVQDRIEQRNKKRIVPYNGCNPKYIYSNLRSIYHGHLHLWMTEYGIDIKLMDAFLGNFFSKHGKENTYYENDEGKLSIMYRTKNFEGYIKFIQNIPSNVENEHLKLQKITQFMVNIFRRSAKEDLYNTDWNQMLNIISSEFYPKLSIALKEVIDDEANDVESNNLGINAIKTVSELLQDKKKSLTDDEIKYFIHIINEIKYSVDPSTETNNVLFTPRPLFLRMDNVNANNELTWDIISDIYSVHNSYIRHNNKTSQYTIRKLLTDIDNNCQQQKQKHFGFIKNEKHLKPFLSATIKLPSFYLIQDDMKQIMNYVFAASYLTNYIKHVKNQMNIIDNVNICII